MRTVLLAWLVVIIGMPLLSAQDKPTPDDEPKPLAPDEWEALTRVGKTLRFKMITADIELKTDYGTLKLPKAEIFSIDFGMRISDSDQKAIATAIEQMERGTPMEREQAKDALLELGVKGYPALVRAIKTATTDASPHLIRLRDTLWTEGSGDEPRDWDIVNTADGSTFTGIILPDQFRIRQDAEEIDLSRAELSTVQRGQRIAMVPKYDLVDYNSFASVGTSHMDKVVGVQITAAKVGSVWGDLRYTSDSYLGAAAIHAGVLKEGETAIVIVKILPDPGAYTGKERNGIQSSSYGRWHWSYSFVGKDKAKANAKPLQAPGVRRNR